MGKEVEADTIDGFGRRVRIVGRGDPSLVDELGVPRTPHCDSHDGKVIARRDERLSGVGVSFSEVPAVLLGDVSS